MNEEGNHRLWDGKRDIKQSAYVQSGARVINGREKERETQRKKRVREEEKCHRLSLLPQPWKSMNFTRVHNNQFIKTEIMTVNRIPQREVKKNRALRRV